jgi:lysophospholipase L1-like esterase
MIADAHQREIHIFGATIMPFKGNSYYNEHSDLCRNTVNDWIRNSGSFDAVIDFEKVLQHPEDDSRIISSYQNDGLHPDAEGYKKMGEAVDLKIFTGF